jgi:hypothetical protein
MPDEFIVMFIALLSASKYRIFWESPMAICSCEDDSSIDGTYPHERRCAPIEFITKSKELFQVCLKDYVSRNTIASIS